MSEKIYRNKTIEPEGFPEAVSMDDIEDGTTYGKINRKYVDDAGNIKAKSIEVEWALITGSGKPADYADVTSNSPQDYSWVTGTKPPTNADNTAANPQNVAWLTDAGAMAYENMVEYAKLGTTVIVGGYIKTELLTASNIVTGILTAVTVRTNAATYPYAVIDSSGLTIHGQYCTFKTLTGTLHGYVYGDEIFGGLVVASAGSYDLSLFSNGGYIYQKCGSYTVARASTTGMTYYRDLYLSSAKKIYWASVYYLTHNGDVFKINDDLQPDTNVTRRLGYTNIAWYAVHSANYLACALPTSKNGMDVFRKIKTAKIKDKDKKGKKYHAGKRHYFEIEEFPDEMKMTDKDSGEKDIELTRTLGVTVNALRELIETTDDMNNRLKALEK